MIVYPTSNACMKILLTLLSASYELMQTTTFVCATLDGRLLCIKALLLMMQAIFCEFCGPLPIQVPAELAWPLLLSSPEGLAAVWGSSHLPFKRLVGHTFLVEHGLLVYTDLMHTDLCHSAMGACAELFACCLLLHCDKSVSPSSQVPISACDSLYCGSFGRARTLSMLWLTAKK